MTTAINNTSIIFTQNKKSGRTKSLLSLVSLVLDGFMFIPFSADIVYITNIRKKNNIIRTYMIYIILTTIGGLVGFMMGKYYSDTISPILSNKFSIDINKYIKNQYYLITLLLLKSFIPLPVAIANMLNGISNTNILVFISSSLIMRTIRFVWLDKVIQIATSRYYKIAVKAFKSFTAVSLIGALDIVNKMIQNE